MSKRYNLYIFFPAHQAYGGLNYRWNKFSFSFQANYVGGNQE